jgi:hydroxyquinol 1,2-dioxygenase
LTAEPVGRVARVDAVGSAAAALRELAVDLDLTNAELLGVVAFISEVAREGELILLSDVLGISRVVDDQTHARARGTASNVLGPFYIPDAPWIENPGSVIRGADDGERLTLVGRVRDAATGRPLESAVVDVWQADGSGRYSNESSDLDPWHLRGRQRTGTDGRYRVETVRPLHYTVKPDGPVGRLLAAMGRHPWRPAHVHFRVTANGYRELVTQAYPAGGPYLDDDAITGVKNDLVVPVADGTLPFDISMDPMPR